MGVAVVGCTHEQAEETSVGEPWQLERYLGMAVGSVLTVIVYWEQKASAGMLYFGF